MACGGLGLTREEAIAILKTWNEELMTLMGTVKKEHDDLENYIVTLANQFTATVAQLQGEEQQEADHTAEDEEKPKPPKARRRRKRGTELTLDD